jgi:hypothetical protein
MPRIDRFGESVPAAQVFEFLGVTAARAEETAWAQGFGRAGNTEAAEKPPESRIRFLRAGRASLWDVYYRKYENGRSVSLVNTSSKPRK